MIYSVLNSDNNFDIIISGCFKAECVEEYKENEELPDEIKYKFYPTFDYLILLGENEELVLKLNRDDLSCFEKRHWYAIISKFKSIARGKTICCKSY